MELNFIRRLLIAVISCTVTFAANAQTYTPETEAEGFVDLYTAILADASLLASGFGNEPIYHSIERFAAVGRASSGIRASPLFLNGYHLYTHRVTGININGFNSPTELINEHPGERTRYIFLRNNVEVIPLIETHLAGKMSQADIDDIVTYLVRIGSYTSNGITLRGEPAVYFLPGDIQARLEAARRVPAEQQAAREAEQRRLAAAMETERQRLADLEAERLQVAADRQKLAELETEIAEVKAELESISRELVARAVAGMTPAPSASSGGSSGAGAAVAVAAIGGVIYWLQKRNPTATFNFAAMPIDTDAYTAQFNFAPRENWNINFEFTEGNLFAENDFVKPDTNRTAKLTVRWSW